MTADRDMIDAFIRERGVTHCPAAVAAPTQAQLSAQDIEAHRLRGIDPVGDSWRKKERGLTGWARYWAHRRATP